jgi:hypothetical protein
MIGKITPQVPRQRLFSARLLKNSLKVFRELGNPKHQISKSIVVPFAVIAEMIRRLPGLRWARPSALPGTGVPRLGGRNLGVVVGTIDFIGELS